MTDKICVHLYLHLFYCILTLFVAYGNAAQH